jgi:hypothetical protein
MIVINAEIRNLLPVSTLVFCDVANTADRTHTILRFDYLCILADVIAIPEPRLPLGFKSYRMVTPPPLVMPHLLALFAVAAKYEPVSRLCTELNAETLEGFVFVTSPASLGEYTLGIQARGYRLTYFQRTIKTMTHFGIFIIRCKSFAAYDTVVLKNIGPVPPGLKGTLPAAIHRLLPASPLDKNDGELNTTIWTYYFFCHFITP